MADAEREHAPPGNVGLTGSLPCEANAGANCDGAVTSVDAALALQFGAGLTPALPCEANADANGDGDVSSIDAALMLQFVAGLLPALPA